MPKSLSSVASIVCGKAPRGEDSTASYGLRSARVQLARRLSVWAALLLAGLISLFSFAPALADGPVKIVAFGDSLTAGYGLAPEMAFPAKLEKALAAKGIAVEISNAGVSGETMSDGLARLDWSIPPDTQAVILELGANDMLRALDPQVTRMALAQILRWLDERHIAVLLCGMLAAPNLGPDYVGEFNSIFPEAAAAHHLPLYPFFLAGVVNERGLTQRDGLHPTEAGVDVIVARILPKVEALVEEARKREKQ
jgi:acyl-CoA thioesterase I